MEHKNPDLKNRLSDIIDISYKILCNKISAGSINVYNEASLQLQFSVILKTIGHLYEFEKYDIFEIELEKKINLKEKTWKSNNKKARCDIWISLSNSKTNKSESAAIELKYFRKSQGETTTDNRFSLLCDLENLEHYQNISNNIHCYSITYTNNPNYSKSNSTSYINIGNECSCSGKIISNKKEVNLENNYIFSWDIYINEYYFLKIKLPNS